MIESRDGGLWGRATFALAVALYAWLMMGLALYLRSAPSLATSSAPLATFRRALGPGVLALGAVAVIIATVLGVTSRRRRGLGWIAVALAVAWVGALALL